MTSSHSVLGAGAAVVLEELRRNKLKDAEGRFALGLLFVPGMGELLPFLEDSQKSRVLVDPTSGFESVESLTRRVGQLDTVCREIEAWAYPSRVAERQMIDSLLEGTRASIELADPSTLLEETVKRLCLVLDGKNTDVGIYTHGPLQSRACIVSHSASADTSGGGFALLGTSNLTIPGPEHATEQTVVIRDDENVEALKCWFDGLWEDSRNITNPLLDELRRSWPMYEATPWEVYIKTAFRLLQGRITSRDDEELLWNDEVNRQLTDFQRDAVQHAVAIIHAYGGAFVADVVGLGKSFIGAAVVKHFQRTESARPLIICPASLTEMWESYNEMFDLQARVVSIGLLRENADFPGGILSQSPLYRDRDFVLVDESHNFRHPGTQRYEILQAYLGTGRRCCFLTATPRNKSALDVYHQIKLFHQDDRTRIPVDPPVLRDFFSMVESGDRQLPDLLRHILIRRRRRDVLRFYGRDAETHEPIDPRRFGDYLSGDRQVYIKVGGEPFFFPRRELSTIEYSIESVYQGLHETIRDFVGRRGEHNRAGTPRLLFARYGLSNYVLTPYEEVAPYDDLARIGQNLCGLMRILLFKRFESSVHAFRMTIQRLIRTHERFLMALDEGIVAAGEDAQRVLTEAGGSEERDFLDAIRELRSDYSIEHFDVESLRADIEHDTDILREIGRLVEPITPDKDAKLQTLLVKLLDSPLAGGKQLIFTQYADTATYLHENLAEKLPSVVDVIHGQDSNRSQIVRRFAPQANPGPSPVLPEEEIATLFCTDVLSEGLNLHDCNKIVNYDLHWNPVKLIQRFGRIDRIGSQHEVVMGFNFLPETAIERELGLQEKLKNRIREIHETIGEDAAILDSSEQLNTDAMYAIYQGDAKWSEEDEEGTNAGQSPLVDAEEALRGLKSTDPEEFERITGLPDGIRSSKAGTGPQLLVLCEAADPDQPTGTAFQVLYTIGEEGIPTVVDANEALMAMACDTDEPRFDVAPSHSDFVARAKEDFVQQVMERRAERSQSTRLTRGQEYVVRNLRALFEEADEQLQVQLQILETAFRAPVATAVNRELNQLRRAGASGSALVEQLTQVYYDYRLRDRDARRQELLDPLPEIRVVSSEAIQ